MQGSVFYGRTFLLVYFSQSGGDKMINNEHKRIYILLAFGITIISFSSILIKLATAPPLAIAFYRLLLAVIFFTPYLLLNYRKDLKHFRDYRLAVVGFFLALHFIFWINSLQLTNVASSVVFVSLQPLFTLVLEYIFTREDFKKGVAFGAIMAIVGSVVISIGDVNKLFSMFWGDMLALTAGLLGAVYLFLGRNLRDDIDYFPYIYIVYTYTAIFVGFFVLITGTPLTGFTSHNYWIFLLLALGPTMIGHSIWNYSVRFLPATVVSISALVEPLLSSTWALLILGETVSAITFIGAILILWGIYVAIKGNKKAERDESL